MLPCTHPRPADRQERRKTPRVGGPRAVRPGDGRARVSVPRDVAHAHAMVVLSASAPVLLHRFIAHTLQPGPAVSLNCKARATPTPHITWTLDGFPLPQSHR
ncbi:hypothetical protein HAZT_HAZT010653 [Hyalella azteca]|uniref:Ig-like domain-containing protein n=1 Tax=Hyalella azteca TaxID=294128 RepID=A0A6A0HAL0_HYAAZ|nr:hypothetical protein HAZT_HAZT010653 [Hyalella azteca]